MAAEYDHLPVYKAAYDLLQHVYRDLKSVGKGEIGRAHV